MAEVKCANCEKVFHRESPLRWPLRCPSCQLLLTEKQAKYALPLGMRLRRVARGPKKVIRRILAKRRLKRFGHTQEVSDVVKKIQKSVGVRPLGAAAMPDKYYPTVGLGIPRKPIYLTSKSNLRSQMKQVPKFKKMQQLAKGTKGIASKSLGGMALSAALPARRLIAHEVAHQTQVGRKVARGVRGRFKNSEALIDPVKIWHAGHNPTYKSARRHVEKVMKKTGTMKQLRKLGYARALSTLYGYDPKLQKSITKVYTDLGVKPPVGKGLHTPAFHRLAAKFMSEGMVRNHAYATAMKTLGGKKAVNPSHQRQKEYIKEHKMIKYAAVKPTLEARIASGAGRFAKRHSVLLSMLIAAPAIASEIQLLVRKIDEKRAVENYAGLGSPKRVMRKLVGRAKRRRRFRQGVMSFPKRHPKLSMVAGGVGLGAWGMQRSQRRREPQQYATPTYPRLSTSTPAAPGTTAKIWGTTKRLGKATIKSKPAQIALGGLISWIAISVLRELERKRIPAIGPYMPDVRPDIELARYTIGQVVTYAADIPEEQLYAIREKALQTLAKMKTLPQKAKRGVEKGLLMWLLGFISAEILGRGITTPKRKIRVEGEVPVRQASYGRSVIPMDSGHREHLKGINPHDPKGWAAKNKAFEAETARMVKGVKRTRRRATVSAVVGTARRHPGKVAAATLPWMALAGLVAARHKRRKEQKYFAVGAAVKGAAKVGKWATARKWGNRAFTGLIIADVAGAVVPRKKKPLTSVQTGSTYRAPQYYTIARIPVRRLMELRRLVTMKTQVKGKNRAISKSMLEVANRIIAERKVLAAAGVGAGIGGVMVGKRLERRRIKKAIG